MNNSNQKINKSKNDKELLPGGAIQKIKTEIRNWYGGLSVRELVTNSALVAEIEKLERLLMSQVVVR